MKVLIVGEGSREHAIAWKIASSPHKPRIMTAPGNAGTAQLGDNFDVPAGDIEGLIELAKEESADLTFIGPEVPLAAGIVDRFHEEGLRVFGPTKAAARIEASKSFAKDVMAAANVPTAEAEVFHSAGAAIGYVESATPPFVVKADGLAAGKGVIMSETPEEAVGAINSMFVSRDFGSAGDKVLIEQWLRGQEVSVFAFVDGPYVSEMTAACDYKRARDGDLGLNTGGMGSYSPPPFWDDELDARVRAEIVEPVAAQMAEMGCPFQGILYAGLMITEDGPKVIEFNCRMGDPEAQVVIPRLMSDLLELALCTVEGTLSEQKVEWSDDSWVGVVLASDGYPGGYETGFEVSGLPEDSDESVVFHAGTKLCEVLETDQNTKITTSGGRVLTVASRGDTVADARCSAYQAVSGIQFGNVYYRRDIGAGV
ncbi:MAG: phosphoribosylamine--glycine ligase [Dehalococcoidia bacterium]|nr:phosphoribosylamine--glycine ligase [Dehalococcoidia bacterium]